MKGVVVNWKRFESKGVNGCVYIGRNGFFGYDFGNVFVIGVDGNRKEVIEKFERWSRERGKVDMVYRSKVKGLYGKVLMCWCKPLDCHGDVLLKLSEEWNYEDLEEEE